MRVSNKVAFHTDAKTQNVTIVSMNQDHIQLLILFYFKFFFGGLCALA